MPVISLGWGLEREASSPPSDSRPIPTRTMLTPGVVALMVDRLDHPCRLDHLDRMGY